MSEYVNKKELLEYLEKCRNDPIFDPDMIWICSMIIAFVNNMKVYKSMGGENNE